MSAHIPRKVFAKSFVVTVAAALPIIAACAHDETQEMSHNPPMPTETATALPSPSVSASASTSTSTSTAEVTATAPITMNPPGPSAPQPEWIVTMAGTTCMSKPIVVCEPNATCNPPPPQAYACPKGLTKDSYPLELTSFAGASQCSATYRTVSSGGCPPGMMCNPPPPQQHTITVPCPH